MKVFPEEITIENFKSIRRLTLRPRPGVNVLVGPNMAGKTNILEAVYFLARALSQAELLKTPYLPHLPQYCRAPEMAVCAVPALGLRSIAGPTRAIYRAVENWDGGAGRALGGRLLHVPLEDHVVRVGDPGGDSVRLPPASVGACELPALV